MIKKQLDRSHGKENVIHAHRHTPIWTITTGGGGGARYLSK